MIKIASFIILIILLFTLIFPLLLLALVILLFTSLIILQLMCLNIIWNARDLPTKTGQLVTVSISAFMFLISFSWTLYPYLVITHKLPTSDLKLIFYLLVILTAIVPLICIIILFALITASSIKKNNLPTWSFLRKATIKETKNNPY